MKKTLFLIFSLPWMMLSAETKLQEMISVNKCWNDNPDGICHLNTQFKDKNPIIQHLILVEKTLRLRSSAHLNETQKRNRIKNLDNLCLYYNAKIVPVNDYVNRINPIFIDRKGTHCAVGQLIKESGYPDLALKIDKNYKFSYIMEINSPELLEWQKESGFTLGELAWIQPGYTYFGSASQIGAGLNGEVKDIFQADGKYTLIAAGRFTIDNTGDTSILAGFDGNNWKSIIKGDGFINKIERDGHKITSYGRNISFANFQNVEIIETDISGQVPLHSVIADFDAEVYGFEIFKGKKYVCGKFTGGLARQDGSNWTVLPSSYFNHPKSIQVYKEDLYIAGDINESQYGFTLTRYDGSNFTRAGSGISNVTPYPQSALGLFNGNLLIGLKTDQYTDTLLYCFNGTDVYRFDSFISIYGDEITSIVAKDPILLVCGNFSSGMMHIGNGITLLNSADPTQSSPLIKVDGYINKAIVKNNNEFIIAGNFRTFYKYALPQNQPNASLYGVGVVYRERTNTSSFNKDAIRIYPNPSTGKYKLQGFQLYTSIQVVDATGRQVVMNYDPKTNTIDLLDANAGVYFLFIQTNDRLLEYKLIKQ